MFQFPAFAIPGLPEIEYLTVSRFSHSDIHGSSLVCSYPQLFAAYHVLRRLQEPRHPPYALIRFLTFTSPLFYPILILALTRLLYSNPNSLPIYAIPHIYNTSDSSNVFRSY